MENWKRKHKCVITYTFLHRVKIIGLNIGLKSTLFRQNVQENSLQNVKMDWLWCYVHRRALEPFSVRPGSLISGHIAMDSRMGDH